MEDYSPESYGQVGINYADWHKMAGFDKAGMFPAAAQSPSGSAPPKQQSVSEQWTKFTQAIGVAPKPAAQTPAPMPSVPTLPTVTAPALVMPTQAVGQPASMADFLPAPLQ